MNIDPTAWVAPGAIVLGDVTLGERSSVWYGAILRGDNDRIVVGAETNLQDGTIVHVDEGVPCLIGRRVGVGHRALLHGCTVQDECLIGMSSTILNRAVIGTGSVVAAGALVPEGMKVPPGSLVMGVPGRVVRPVDDQLRERIQMTWVHYIEQARRHASGQFPFQERSSSPLSPLHVRGEGNAT